MARHTSFRIGGPADALIAPKTVDDLEKLVKSARIEGIPLTILGGGANVVVSDRGIRGIVVETRSLASIEAADAGPASDGGPASEAGQASGAGQGAGRTRLRAGAGVSMSRLCEFALARGLGGLENFYAMPGSLGGSAFMNARCYEVEMADRLEGLTILDRRGDIRPFPLDHAAWTYKTSPLQPGREEEGSIILEARFVLGPADRAALRATMLARRADREAKGHFRLPSAGSMFKNDRGLGRPTGAILDELGLKGRRIGDAMVSPWHANIFVNAGRASSHDILALVDFAREEALKRLGVSIVPEVLFIGEK